MPKPTATRYFSWDSFKTNYKKHLLNGPDRSSRIVERFVFRGQANEHWPLTAAFDRAHSGLGFADRENGAREQVRHFLEALRRTRSEDYGQEDERAMALAQHHGLPTRLLDWSYSPYVAAYFAFSSRLRDKASGRIKPIKSRIDYVSIWALDTEPLRKRDLGPIRPNQHPDPDRAEDADRAPLELWRVLDPKNTRLGNQQGAFTLLNGETEDLVQHATASKSLRLVKFRILPDQMVPALDDLILMGIHEESIFPGIDGIASRLNLNSLLEDRRARDAKEAQERRRAAEKRALAAR